MLRISTLILMAFIVLFAAAQPNFRMAGFATENGGTTGGYGGDTVRVDSYNRLKTYAESARPYVIEMQGTLTNGPGGGQINIRSNKTLIGLGDSTLLQGVGLAINNSRNIILRNFKITMVGLTTPKNTNDGDCISIYGSSKNIWIDHCELFSEDPDKQTDIDKYDGLIDIKQNTGFITISWCYLHDHHKGGLVGASDSDIYGDRKITFHHNYYNKVRLRVPMYRGATGHFFNNYIVGAKDATEIRANTCVRVEKNYYEALHYSIYTPSDAPGKTERIDNIEVNHASRPYPANCVADIPYTYNDVLTEETRLVKREVPQYAGVGKLSNDCNGVLGGDAFMDDCGQCAGGDTGVEPCQNVAVNKLEQTVKWKLYPNPGREVLQVEVPEAQPQMADLQVFDASGRQVWHEQLTQQSTSIALKSWKAGVYIVQVSDANHCNIRRFVKLP